MQTNHNADTIQLRLLSAADAAAFRALRLRALRDHPEAFGGSYEDLLQRSVEAVAEQLGAQTSQPDNFVVGAFSGTRLAGTTGFRREQGTKVRHKGLIWGVYVAPEMRGRGVAHALLTDTIARAARLPGLEQIVLAVATENIPARQLYLRLGFQSYGVERHALKLADRYVDEDLMVVFLHDGSEQA